MNKICQQSSTKNRTACIEGYRPWSRNAAGGAKETGKRRGRSNLGATTLSLGKVGCMETEARGAKDGRL